MPFTVIVVDDEAFDRTSVRLSSAATRALPVDGGWAVLADTTLALTDADGALRTSVDLT